MFKPVIEEAKSNGIPVRGYVSCVMGCPYEGDVDPAKVNYVANKLIEMGCYEVSLGDTIGAGNAEKTHLLFQNLSVPINLIAAHFHDTNDTAIENILVALSYGVTIFDSSVAGLGGCPYAKKSAGNVCSETVIYTLEELGIDTGVDLGKLSEVGDFVTEKLGIENLSLVPRV